MQADDVAPAQQLIELYLLDRHIINPENMMFETEHLAAKGVAQAGNLQPDGTAPDNPRVLPNNSLPTSPRLSPAARTVASAETIRRKRAIISPMANSLTAWTASLTFWINSASLKPRVSQMKRR